jgi:hypothetical protein
LEDEKSGLDSGFVRPTIAFHAGEDAARGPARVEIALAGNAGVELTVRFPPGVPWSEAHGLAEGFTAEGKGQGPLNLGAPTAPAAGGVAATNARQTPDPLVAAVRYPGAGTRAERAASAACADAHRMLAVRAFASALVTHRAPDTIGVRVELVSCVVACVGNAARAARVAWTGPPGPGGGLAAAFLVAGADAAAEDALCEAARAGDVDAFVAALGGKDGDH